MAITAFPLNLTEYIGAEPVMLSNAGRTTGVIKLEDNLKVSAQDNSMTIAVSGGIAVFSVDTAHTIISNISDTETLNISTADNILDRIDRVIMRLPITNYANLPYLTVIKGEPAATPTPPAITRNSSYYDIALADVFIPAGAISINQSNITDKRADNNLCGVSVTCDVSAAISSQAFLAAHPVGSLFVTSQNINPAEEYGGSWTRIKDKFILAAGDSFAAGTTGGAAAVTLAAENMATKIKIPYGVSAAGSRTVISGQQVFLSGTASGYAAFENIDGTAGQAFNNMPPYTAKYVWERIA